MKRKIRPLLRLSRRLRGLCIVCGRKSNHRKERYWYCSFECGCYDGTMSVKNKKLPKPSIWRGHTTFYSLREEK